MRILILGAGKMGLFFSDVLSKEHDVAICDVNPERLRFTFGARRFASLDEIDDFRPQLMINAVTLDRTLEAFRQVIPHLPKDCILSDIASVKTGLKDFYTGCGFPFVSTHPMFGPTFASLSNLTSENAIVISEGDSLGRAFFRDLYASLRLNVKEYTFADHDATIAYSIGLPFATTLIFAGIMQPQEAPGTTFKRHMNIAHGVLGEDDRLVSEILFNPHTASQLEQIQQQLRELADIVEHRDASRLHALLASYRLKFHS